jgi:hypothetical protein
VHDEVVDGLVGDGPLAFVAGLGGVDVGCGGDHVEDGFGVGDCEVFALLYTYTLAMCDSCWCIL